jgi:hypothetical protein
MQTAYDFIWGTSLPTTETSKHTVHNIKAGGDVFMTCKSILPLVQLSQQVALVFTVVRIDIGHWAMLQKQILCNFHQQGT